MPAEGLSGIKDRLKSSLLIRISVLVGIAAAGVWEWTEKNAEWEMDWGATEVAVLKWESSKEF